MRALPYLYSQVYAIAEMNSLQAAVMIPVIFVGDNVSISILSHPGPLICLGQGNNAFICNVGTLDQPDPLQFGERGQSSDRLVC